MTTILPTKSSRSLLISILALVATIPLPPVVLAHHSYVMFDRNKVISISGTVRKILRVSPHGTIWLYVPNDKGGQDLWAVQLTAVGGMDRDESIKEGDKLTLEINPLKDGRTGGSLVRVHLSDGRVLSNNGEQPAAPPP